MERPIQQNYAPVWRLVRLCLIPIVLSGIAVQAVLYYHGRKDPVRLSLDLLEYFLVWLPVMLAIVLARAQPTVKWFITDDGLKRVIRGNALMIPWQQIYHMANTNSGFFVHWRDPAEAGVSRESLEHRALLYPAKADAEELIAGWQKKVSHEAQIGTRAHSRARNRRTSQQAVATSRAFMLLAAALISWGGWNIARQYPSTSWPSVDGKVTSIYHVPPISSRRHASGTVTLSYEYAVDGVTHQSDRYGLVHAKFRDEEGAAEAFAQGHRIGAIVKVYYNPKHPEQAVLLTGPSWSDNLALVFAGGFLGFVSGLVRIVDNMAKRAQKMQKY
jgi:hypothetical protein